MNTIFFKDKEAAPVEARRVQKRARVVEEEEERGEEKQVQKRPCQLLGSDNKWCRLM